MLLVDQFIPPRSVRLFLYTIPRGAGLQCDLCLDHAVVAMNTAWHADHHLVDLDLLGVMEYLARSTRTIFGRSPLQILLTVKALYNIEARFFFRTVRALCQTVADASLP